MIILHCSDTHLGYHDLDKVNAIGINAREQDFYDAFQKVVDDAIEREVDLVVHSGDFFHRPSPANRPMIFALQQVMKLSQAGIPFVVIAGNHETPKTIFTSPILKAFESLDHVFPIFDQRYEVIEFDRVAVHGLPHINDERILLEEMDRISPVADKFNIILLHTSIGKEYMMDEFGEQLYPAERIELLNQFDYVALGHWHNHQKVSKLKTGYYSGSTERMSETEIGKEKGYYLLELKKENPAVPEFQALPARPWHKMEIQDCLLKTAEEMETEIGEKVKAMPLQEALLSLVLHQIKPLQSLQLSNRRLQELIPQAFHLHIKRHFVQQEGMSPSRLAQQTESIDQLILAFIGEHTDDEKRVKALSAKARHYFHLFQTGEYKNR